MSAGFPGAFPAGLTTGNMNIGAVQKTRTGKASLGAFPAGLTTGYMNIGAVQLAPATPGGTAANMFLVF